MKKRIAALSILLTFLFVFQAALPSSLVYADKQVVDHAMHDHHDVIKDDQSLDPGNKSKINGELPAETVTQTVYDNIPQYSTDISQSLTGIGVKVEYFGDWDFEERLATRIEDKIDYEAEFHLPDLQDEQVHSIRWSGVLTPAYSEEYTFRTESLGNIRLWVNNQQLIDGSIGFGNKDKGRISLQAGIPVTIKMEYQSGLLGGYAKLLWSSKSQKREVVQAPYLDPPFIPGIPQDVRTVAKSSQSIQIEWAPVEGAASYEIEVDGAIVDNGSNTSFNHEQLQPYSQHIYRIRAKVPEMAGEWSSPYMDRTYVGVPTHVIAEVGQDSINVSWDPVDGAVGYELEADGIVIPVGLETVYIHAGLMPNTTHTYRVRTIGEESVSEWSTLFSQTVQSLIPTHLQAVAGNHSITINWDIVTGATGYEVEVDGGVIDAGLALSYVHGGLTPNTQHRYRVRAILENGPGGWSEYVTASSPLATGAGSGLKGDYYTNESMDELAASRIDPNIDYDWKNRSPIDGSLLKRYAVRWTGQLEPRYTEEYTLLAEAHGGVRVWIDEEMLIDEWRFNGMHWGSGKKRLEAGHRYDIRIEYRKPMGAATMKMYWKSDSQRTEIIPQSQLYPIGVPGGLRVDSNETSVTLQWDAVTFAAGYEVEADGVVRDVGDSSSFVDDALIPGTYHSYRIRAVNGVAVGEWSATVSRTTRLGTSVITDMQAEETRVDVHWAEVAGATGYDIEVDGIIHDNGNQTAFSHLDLQPGTEHDYRVRAKTAAVIGDWTPMAVKWTLPDVPTNLRASSTSSAIEVSWDPVVGATHYEIEAYHNVVDVGPATSYQDTHLNANSQHAYRVRAVNDSGPGQWSSVLAKLVLPGAPDNLRGTASDTQIEVNWDASSGAQSYELEIDAAQVEHLQETSYMHAGLIANSSHMYRVRSISEEGVSEWSLPIEVTTLPAVPGELQAIIDGDAIQVIWQPVDGADGYELEINGNRTDAGQETSLTISGIVPNAAYSIRVRARKGELFSRWSEQVETIVTPGIPTNLAATATSTEVMVTWDPVAGATAYEIEVDGVIQRVEGTSFKHIDVQANTVHHYQVRALNAGGAGNWSEEVMAIVQLNAPKNLTAVASTEEIKLGWDTIDGAEGYEVLVDGEMIDVGSATIYLHQHLEPYTVHVYRVRAKSTLAKSEWSETLTQSTRLATPSNITGKTQSKEINLQWDTVTGATYYAVEWDELSIENTTDPSFIHAELEPDSEHSYRVKALNDSTDSVWSETVVLRTAPAIPTNIQSSAETDSISLSWDSVPGVISYVIEADGEIVNLNDHVYTHTKLRPNTMHVYRIGAVGKGGTSWSDYVQASTKPELQIDVGQDTIFNFLIVVPAMPGKEQAQITVHYQPDELEVLDLSAQTPLPELAPGSIEGTNITVLAHEQGTIIYLITQTHRTMVNSIQFMAKTNEYTAVSYEIK